MLLLRIKKRFVQTVSVISVQDQVNFYICSCVPGYYGRNCEKDADDCTPNPCSNGATCTVSLHTMNCMSNSDYFQLLVYMFIRHRSTVAALGAIKRFSKQVHNYETTQKYDYKEVLLLPEWI